MSRVSVIFHGHRVSSRENVSPLFSPGLVSREKTPEYVNVNIERARGVADISSKCLDDRFQFLIISRWQVSFLI